MIGLGIPYTVYISRQDVTGIGVGVLMLALIVVGLAVLLDRVLVRFVALFLRPGKLAHQTCRSR